MFYTTFNNILAISWLSVLLVEETEVPGENQSHWQTLSHMYTDIVSQNSQTCVHFNNNIIKYLQSYRLKAMQDMSVWQQNDQWEWTFGILNRNVSNNWGNHQAASPDRPSNGTQKAKEAEDDIETPGVETQSQNWKSRDTTGTRQKN
jgi:hypothetical protein